ncbi:MAG: hypothetical protein ABL957_03635 [Parvularculaceae bacterium]
MALESLIPQEAEALSAALERYLSDILHHPALLLRPLGRIPGAPTFLDRSYAFYEARIADRRCVFLLASGPAHTPAAIAKHLDLARGVIDDAVIILATSTLSAHNRARLIGHGVAFAVPGNQLYVPELAVDLREHFRTPRSGSGKGLSPAAQSVLFHYLLRRDSPAMTSSVIAVALRCSAMSVSRAFDNLSATGLASTVRAGRERRLQFAADRRELFDGARPLLRSPVRTVKHVLFGDRFPDLKRAGDSALADLSALTPPLKETYAASAQNWKTLVSHFHLKEVVEHEGSRAVETWSYDPAGLSDGPVVDPLSLYAQFRNHRDERVATAAERLLEKTVW